MGVGEDETLGDSIAVTIIATGFNPEQQSEIVNTEPKKIIHALEDNQKIERDLTAANFVPTTPVIENVAVEEKVVFELVEEFVEAPQPVISENELVFITDLIRNIDVDFEIVSPVKEIDFTFTKPTIEINDIPVVDYKEVEQVAFSFDLPISETKSVEENKFVFDLSPETKNIDVKEAIEFIPITEVQENGIIKYSLEEYMEIESDLIGSKPVAAVQEPVNEELNITIKQVETNAVTSTHGTISPMEMSIEETLRFRAEERRRKLKEFNYKFHNNPSKVEEFEKEPAYKRSGIDITTNQALNNNSRMSLGTDSNDDIQLRSNNSFLHDNVD
jgi:cell division protein FtsZ